MAKVLLDKDMREKFKGRRFQFLRGYAVLTYWDKKLKKSQSFFVHRYITKAKKGESVDHLNGNRSDNRRINLRVGTHSQNMFNPNNRLNKNNKTGVRGVCMLSTSNYNRNKKFLAHVTHNYKAKKLGYFRTLEEATKARKQYEDTLDE